MRRSKQNPEGYCVVAVAENRQTIDMLQERLSRTAPVSHSAFFYDNFAGIDRMRSATAGFLTRTFMKVSALCIQALESVTSINCDPKHVPRAHDLSHEP